MTTELPFEQLLKEKVEETFGRKPGSPADFIELASDINNRTNESLGLSTLKRFWGYVKTTYTPTYSTLSVMARYAGFRDWHNFCTRIQAQEESGFSKDGIVASADLKMGVKMRIEWSGNKLCILRKIGHPSRFEVTEALNVKLKAGDTLSIDIVTVGEKFKAAECVRDGVSLGTYLSSGKEGVISISFND